jgi:hypothetical protein
LLPLVYGRLRKSAQIDLGGERLGHTLTRSRVGVAVLRIAELDSELTRDARCSHLRESELLLLEGYQGLREREACIASDGKVRVSEALARANLSSPPAATEKP